MYGNNLSIETFDKDLWDALESERIRQEQHIELIASENYASPRVMEAQGGILTNKYAEGYPGKRYYGGCEFVDVAEQLAIDRAKKLFNSKLSQQVPAKHFPLPHLLPHQRSELGPAHSLARQHLT